MSPFASNQKEVRAGCNFFQLQEQSKNMWSCATTDTAHAERSYLTVVQFTFAEWRST